MPVFNSHKMRNYFLFKLLFVVAAFGEAGSAHAASSNIPSSAIVMPPITVSQPADMRFGSIAPLAIPGTVVLALVSAVPAIAPTTATPVISGNRTATGGVVMVGGGTCSAIVLCGVGSLQIQGPAFGTFTTITLPATVTLTSGADTMTVNALTRRYGQPATPGTTSGVGSFNGVGTAVLLVCGTLLVGANQASGSYTGTMPITVDY